MALNLQHYSLRIHKLCRNFKFYVCPGSSLVILLTSMKTNSRFHPDCGFTSEISHSEDGRRRLIIYIGVQQTNFVCSNSLLNSPSLSTKFIKVIYLDTLLQLLTEKKAYYLDIKAGLLWISSRICSCNAEKKILNLAIYDCRRANPTRCASRRWIASNWKKKGGVKQMAF